jgi:hypothetical protein
MRCDLTQQDVVRKDFSGLGCAKHFRLNDEASELRYIAQISYRLAHQQGPETKARALPTLEPVPLPHAH